MRNSGGGAQKSLFLKAFLVTVARLNWITTAYYTLEETKVQVNLLPSLKITVSYEKQLTHGEIFMIQASQRKQEKKSMYIVNSTKLKNVAKETRLEEYMPECLSDLKVK